MPKTNLKVAIEAIRQSVYINPLTDFGFKKLFLKKELMIAFLNDIIGKKIKDIQYEPTEGLGAHPRERKAIFDILCTTRSGEHFIVEMQLGKQTCFLDRILFYASHAIRKQAPRKKNWDYKLKAVYVVPILNFIAFKEKKAQHIITERVYLYRENAQTPYSKKLNFIFVELPKFKKKAEELETNTDGWLFLLKNTCDLKTCPPEITREVFKSFLEEAKVEYLTQTEMETYAKSLSESYEVMDIANCNRMEGRREGRRAEHRLSASKLRAERQQSAAKLMEERQLFASKLLQTHTPIDDIIFYTGLTREQIQELLS